MPDFSKMISKAEKLDLDERAVVIETIRTLEKVVKTKKSLTIEQKNKLELLELLLDGAVE